MTPNSQSFPFKVNNIKKDVVTNLENTLTKLRIIEELPDENDSLDDGFLGGRFDRKEEKKRKKKKKTSLAKKEKYVSMLSVLRKGVLSVSAVGAALFIIMIGYHFVSQQISKIHHSTKNRVVLKEKKNNGSVDDNYVFVGDFQTEKFSFEKYGLDYHYVKVGTYSLTTSEMLNHMKDMVYDYNPSVIFIEVGIMDIAQNVTQEHFIQQYGNILDLIAMNRPNAIVYVESIYPVNSELEDGFFRRSISNDEIESYNSLLKALASEKNVQYLDLYSKMIQKNELNIDYTDDGVTLNNKGYQVVYQEIKNVVG